MFDLEVLIPFLVFFIACLSFYQDNKFKDKATPKRQQYYRYGLFVLTLLISIGSIIQLEYIDRPYWYKGEIEGSIVAEPKLWYGESSYTCNCGVDFMFVEDPINVYTHNGKTMLSTIVRNEKGVMIASVMGNTFVVNPNIISDFNYDDSALEVLNKDGDIILQV